MASSASSAPAPATSTMSILVVDACAAVIAVVRAVLRQLGFEDVEEATDGTAALERLKERHYDLVISDWSMEPMSGYALLRHVRSDETLQAMPFIMMTTPTQAEKLIHAKQAGVNNCILKPFSATALRAKLTAIFDLERVGSGPIAALRRMPAAEPEHFIVEV